VGKGVCDTSRTATPTAQMQALESFVSSASLSSPAFLCLLLCPDPLVCTLDRVQDALLVQMVQTVRHRYMLWLAAAAGGALAALQRSQKCHSSHPRHRENSQLPHFCTLFPRGEHPQHPAPPVHCCCTPALMQKGRLQGHPASGPAGRAVPVASGADTAEPSHITT
jgi:hypothetical protein